MLHRAQVIYKGSLVHYDNSATTTALRKIVVLQKASKAVAEKTSEMTRDEAMAIVSKEAERKAKKNAALKKWRSENKPKYNAYIKAWRAARDAKVAEAKRLLAQ